MDIKLYPTLSFYQIGQRGNQEDARYPDTDTPAADCTTFVVCDGVGGLDKGEIASRTVAESIGHSMAAYDGSEVFTDSDFAKVLATAYADLAKRNTGTGEGMATTLTFMHVHAGGVFVAHIGDSRIYQIREGVGVVYRSYDHSLVNVLVRTGNLSPADAVDHPQSNIITRCMGGPDPNRHDAANVFNIVDVRSGDYFLMCSDGVLHQLTDEGLVELLCSSATDGEKMAQLASIAAPSTDNNTAMLVHIAEVSGNEADDSADVDSADEEDCTGCDTHIIEVPAPQAHDVAPDANAAEEPAPAESGSKISRFFRNLFK